MRSERGVNILGFRIEVDISYCFTFLYLAENKGNDYDFGTKKGAAAGRHFTERIY